jgi:hypothetical protein
MYGGIVTDVYVVPDQADRPWLRLEDEFDYKIDQYPLEDLIEDKKGESK